MATFKVTFSQSGMIIPPHDIEAETVEEAVEAGWRQHAGTLERADATVMGPTYVYRFFRRNGRWMKMGYERMPCLGGP